MNITSRHVRENRDGERSVCKFDNGVSIVHFVGREGDYWRRTVVIPRKVIVDAIRKRRAIGYRWQQIEINEILPDDLWMSRIYSGPGMPFCSGLHRIYKNNRKYVVFYSSGGLDI